MSVRISSQHILFDTLHDIWQRERSSELLVPMKEGFYGDIRVFLEKYTSRIESEEDLIVKQILEKRLIRIRYIISDLIEIRTKKLFNLILTKDPVTVNVARQEFDFYERTSKIYEVYNKAIFEPEQVAFVNDLDFTEEKTQDIEENPVLEYVKIRMKKDIEQEIVGLDGESYGPFTPEDVCLIPKENAIGLVKSGLAERIEVKDK